MTNKRGRGRPKSAATIEHERIEALLKNRPEHLRGVKPEPHLFSSDWFEQSERVERAMLTNYRYSSQTPMSHGYSMASLGDETLSGYEKQILGDDARYAENTRQAQIDGGNSRRKNAQLAADSLFQQNADLWSKVQSKRMSLSRAAGIIHDEWDEIPVGSLSAPPNLKQRGAGGPVPSLGTIKNHLKRGALNTNNKISMRKK